MKNIRLIKAKSIDNKRIRVAAYCRVSKLGLAQRTSFDWQIKSYTNIISENLDLILVGVFYVLGKSGLRRKGRTKLNKMLKSRKRENRLYDN